ncbi:3'-5' exonuclease [Vibrio maerlii]|uniref:3'-5' exonuclease n=1 Tax=Vibrio maerlii TaxID=2231648 RepID=UPI000E3BC536|nr:3'-5' exonuclease [Vibrio maerlii]
MKRLFKSPSIAWNQKQKTLKDRAKHPLLVDFYSKELPAPNTPLSEIEFIAMDFETTGLESKKDGILTIGTVPFNLNRVFLNRAKHWTVRPRQQLDEESVVIHGITHNDILDAPDLSEVIEEVLNEMSGKIMVVHYQRIEREFLAHALMERYKEGIEFPVLDTMEIESIIQKKVTGGILNRLKGAQPGSVRLAQSRRRYGLPDYTPHHALTDAIATAELLQAQIAYHHDGDLPVRDFWL